MPTINQVFPRGFQLPRFGVYTSTALVDGKAYPAVTNAGIRPMFETAPLCETHIIGFEGVYMASV